MASANLAALEPASHPSADAASMLHRMWSGLELDKRFPSIIAPEDDGLHDFTDDRADVVYRRGVQISEHIQAETLQHGRRRHPGQ